MITTISRRTPEAPAYPLTVGVIKYKSVTVKLIAVTCPFAARAPGKQGVPYHRQETPLGFPISYYQQSSFNATGIEVKKVNDSQSGSEGNCATNASSYEVDSVCWCGGSQPRAGLPLESWAKSLFALFQRNTMDTALLIKGIHCLIASQQDNDLINPLTGGNPEQSFPGTNFHHKTNSIDFCPVVLSSVEI